MTDNLKTRIAEAIKQHAVIKPDIALDENDKYVDLTLVVDFSASAQAVLDIVEPMITGLVGVIGSQQQTNQALIKRIPKWKSMESAPKDKTDILLSDGISSVVGYWYFNEWSPSSVYSGDSEVDCYIQFKPTHWHPLQTPPEKE